MNKEVSAIGQVGHCRLLKNFLLFFALSEMMCIVGFGAKEWHDLTTVLGGQG